MNTNQVIKLTGVVLGALRVYLDHKLQLATETLQELEGKSCWYTNKQVLASEWAKVLSAARLIVQYIRNLPTDEASSRFHRTGGFALAAIDRSEECFQNQLKSVEHCISVQVKCSSCGAMQRWRWKKAFAS